MIRKFDGDNELIDRYGRFSAGSLIRINIEIASMDNIINQRETMFTKLFALIIILVVALIIFLTELTSNMATTATFLPVVAAIAIQSNFDPLLVTAAVALAASCAFMLPVATPPNAIVFGSGLIRVPQMARAGFLINILGITVVSLVAVFSVPYFLL